MHRLAVILILCVASGVAVGGDGGLTMTGRVINSEGEPLSNATVMVYHAGVKSGYSTFCPNCYKDCGKRATTDVGGTYILRDLNSELWFELLVVRNGYAPTFVRVSPDSSNQPLPVTFLQPRHRTSDASRIFMGRVTDEGGNPVRDAVVKSEGIEVAESSTFGEIPGLDPLAVTDERGDFEMMYAKPANRILLSVEARTYAAKFEVVAAGFERKSIALSRGATVRGRLTRDGQPVGNAEIGLVGQERGGLGNHLKIIGTPYQEMRVGTQEDGSFVIADVPTPFKWYVYPKKESVATRGAAEPKEFETSRAQQTVDVGEIELRPGHRFSGQVQLSDGKPIPEGMRIVLSAQRIWDSQTTGLDSSGHFEFLNLPSGKYSVIPSVRGYRLSKHGNEVEVLIDRDVDDFVVPLEPSLARW